MNLSMRVVLVMLWFLVLMAAVGVWGLVGGLEVSINPSSSGGCG